MDTGSHFLYALIVIVLGVVIGVLASYFARPQWLTKGRLAAVFIAAVVAAAMWTVVEEKSDDNPTVARSPGASSVGATGVQGAATAPPVAPASVDQHALNSMTPATGATNLSALPRALTGQSTYANAVVIHCASGNTGDKVREVTYEIAGNYIDFHAGVTAYDASPEDRIVQLSVFQDAQSKVIQVHIGQSSSVDVPLDGVNQLRFQVSCQTPNAMVVLTGAYLTHK